jgi:hypothetical protein
LRSTLRGPLMQSSSENQALMERAAVASLTLANE